MDIQTHLYLHQRFPVRLADYIGESATSYASSGTNNEDMTGWIDTQLVSQGVAASLIRLVAASVEDRDFCQADGISKGEQTSVSLLPRSIEIQLARILPHLCSRHNAQRRLLLALGVPYTFCSLFVHAVKATRNVDAFLKRTSRESVRRD